MVKKSSKNAEPTIFLIFGGTGDLTKRKIMPALYNLFLEKVNLKKGIGQNLQLIFIIKLPTLLMPQPLRHLLNILKRLRMNGKKSHQLYITVL